MSTLTLLGTAHGFPVSDRNHSSALLRADERLILVDSGEPCSRTLVAMQVQPAELDAILLTHGHSDHTGGLPMLIQSAWIMNRQHPLVIYLPAEIREPLLRWLNASYIGPEFLPFRLDLVAWESASQHSIFGVVVTPTPTTHLHSLRKEANDERFHAFSLVLQAADGEVVVSGDLGKPEDLEPALAISRRLLVSEMAHFAPAALFRYLVPFGLKRLVITHASTAVLAHPHEVLELAKKMLPETRVEIATDGLVIDLGDEK